MHPVLLSSLDHRNRLFALTEELRDVVSLAEAPAIDRLNDMRRRLMMAVIRMQRHKDEAIMPWAFAAGETVRVWAVEIRAREIALYRRFDRFEDSWPEDSAGKNWLEFRKQGLALIEQCQGQMAYSTENFYPLLVELSFDCAVDTAGFDEIDWEAERWKILRRYPRP